MYKRQEARYKDPKYKVEKPSREFKFGKAVLVVISTYIPHGLMGGYNTRLYEDDSYHYYEHNRLEALKFTLACHKHWDSGIPYTLMIVDSNSPDVRALKYFKSLSWPSVHFRENTYFSFGSYRWAWENFPTYDYYVFHEMDWVPARHDWLKTLIDMWVEDKEVGMIGNVVEHRSWTENPTTANQLMNNDFIELINKNRKFQVNLDSEYLFTDRIVLEQMANHGGWLLFPCQPQTDLSPAFNELAMQQPILEMGYKIKCFNDGKHTMFYGIYNQGFPPEWDHGWGEDLAPFVPEQTRLFIPEARNYFDFYKVESNDVIWKGSNLHSESVTRYPKK